MSTPDPLSPLRDSIAEVDRALLELLRRRMDLAAEVGRIKAEAGRPVVVRDVEDRVLIRARQHAEACGVSEEVMEAVFQAIMRGSVERQYRVGIALREQRGERVLIVGGAGGMGNWFRGFLELVGHSVDLADPALGSLPRCARAVSPVSDEVADLDAYAAVLVAVPLGRTPRVLEEVVARVPKGWWWRSPRSRTRSRRPSPRPASEGRGRSPSIPMFGPGKSFYEPLTFVLAAQGDPAEEKGELATLLAHPYTRLVAVPFPHHDRLMGWLLGLAHLTQHPVRRGPHPLGDRPRRASRLRLDDVHAAGGHGALGAGRGPGPLSRHPAPEPSPARGLRRHAGGAGATGRAGRDREREGFRQTLAAARRALSGEG